MKATRTVPSPRLPLAPLSDTPFSGFARKATRTDEGDRVRLLVRIGDHPAGTQAVVKEVHPDGTCTVELGSGERLLVVVSAVAPEAERRRGR